MKRKALLYCSNIVVPLFLGLIIYLSFGGNTYLSAFFGQILKVKINPLPISPWLRQLIRNYVADFLWAYALVFAIDIVFWGLQKHYLLVYIICAAFIMLIEASQMFSLVHGTFDLIDIIVELVAISIATYIITKSEQRGINR